MKTITHRIRTSSHEMSPVPLWLKACYPTIVIRDEFSSVDDLLKKYPPTKPSEKLIHAIEDFFEARRNSVIYNYGKGNVAFYVAKNLL